MSPSRSSAGAPRPPAFQRDSPGSTAAVIAPPADVKTTGFTHASGDARRGLIATAAPRPSTAMRRPPTVSALAMSTRHERRFACVTNAASATTSVSARAEPVRTRADNAGTPSRAPGETSTTTRPPAPMGTGAAISDVAPLVTRKRPSPPTATRRSAARARPDAGPSAPVSTTAASSPHAPASASTQGVTPNATSMRAPNTSGRQRSSASLGMSERSTPSAPKTSSPPATPTPPRSVGVRQALTEPQFS